MDVIDVFALTDVLEQRVVLYNVQGVPADLRHLQALVRKVGLQRADLALHKAEAFVLTVLVALFKQQLHPEADAQQRLLFGFFFDDRYKSRRLQLGHGVGKSAHARQDEPIRFADGVRVRSHNGFQPQLLQAGPQAEQVAHAIIDNCDHTSSPFVEGISSL